MGYNKSINRVDIYKQKRMFCVHIRGQNELLWKSGGKKMSNFWEARGVRERIMKELASDFVF